MQNDTNGQPRASIPDAEIDAAVEAMVTAFHPKMECVVHKYCDEAYLAIMESMTDHLADNASFNFKARVQSLEWEIRNLRACLRAANASLNYAEMAANVEAGERGYWTEAYAENHRAKAMEAQRAETLGSVHDSAVACDLPKGVSHD